VAFPDHLHRASRLFSLILALAMAAMPRSAIAAPEARLVHCGSDTCLRISGHRPHAAVIVRIAGHDLAVEGERSWRATVPLATARAWAGVSGDALVLTLADSRAGTESRTVVSAPPGALGKRIELASLVVRAH
jgi:hypothetical protein